MNQDRQCRQCGETKPLDDYCYGTKEGKRWRRVCRSCRLEQHRKWRKANADYVREKGREYMRRWRDSFSGEEREARDKTLAEKSRKWRAALKDEVYANYGGYICACCGETEPLFLSVDHINNDGYQHRKQGVHGSGVRLYQWLKRNKWPQGFQILCMNCQHGKARNHGVCPHKQGATTIPKGSRAKRPEAPPAQ